MKKYFLGIIIIIISVAFVVHTNMYKHSIVTDELANLEEITVKFSISSGYTEPILLSKSDANDVFLLLSKARATVKKRGGHDAMQFDPPYILTVSYKSGATNTISSMPNGREWFMWIESEYNGGEYLLTKSRSLADILATYFKE